mgnify:FL=1
MVKNLVKPIIIERFKEKPTIENLENLLSTNLSMVSESSFRKIDDQKKIDTFIEELRENIDQNNDQQIKLYNGFYDLALKVSNTPKDSDDRWIQYEEAATNCSYMHLLASFCEYAELDLFLIGVNNDN